MCPSVELDQKSNKPFSFRVVVSTENNKRKEYLLAGNSQEDLNEWLAALRIGGATDIDFANKDRERRQKEEEKQKNIERKKREEQMKQDEEVTLLFVYSFIFKGLYQK
jgi:hypothetical protein